MVTACHRVCLPDIVGNDLEIGLNGLISSFNWMHLFDWIAFRED